MACQSWLVYDNETVTWSLWISVSWWVMGVSLSSHRHYYSPAIVSIRNVYDGWTMIVDYGWFGYNVGLIIWIVQPPTKLYSINLVGGDWNIWMIFPNTVVGMMIQSDLNSIIFQGGRAQPPTSVHTIWLFIIAMENPNHKWRFLAGKIIYFYGPSIYTMAMSVITNPL